MPSSLISIKEYILTHSADEVKRQLPEWQEQLKQQHISSMALQALLSHFAPQVDSTPVKAAADQAGYVEPDSILAADEKELNRLRQENSVLKSRSEQAEREAGLLRARQRVLAGALVAVTLVALFLFVLCCQG